MNILIIGCGKVGSRLADVLCQLGHDVAIIAQKRESFDLLSDDFSGFTIRGVPIDRTFCGRQASRVVTPSLLSPRTITPTSWSARLQGKFSTFLALLPVSSTRCGRTSSPAFDIQSVCPTNITVSSVYAMLTKRTQTRHITVGNEVMSVSTMEPPHELVGLTVEEAARRLQPESLIALVDQTGEISMTVDLLLDPNHFRTIRATDKLLVSTDIR